MLLFDLTALVANVLCMPFPAYQLRIGNVTEIFVHCLNDKMKTISLQ